MQYPFPNDIQQRIQAQLALGSFADEDDVIREAIDSLEKRQRGLQQLRGFVQAAEVDIVGERVASFNAHQTKVAVRARLKQNGIIE